MTLVSCILLGQVIATALFLTIKPDRAVLMTVDALIIDAILSWLRGHTISAGEFPHRTWARLRCMWRTEGRKENARSGEIMWEIRGECEIPMVFREH
jgi:hypothetical protein